jgi:hypothetical protein
VLTNSEFFYSDASILGRLLRGVCPQRDPDVSCAGSVPSATVHSDASILGRLLRGVCPQRDGCDWDLLAFADASCAGSVPSAQHDRDLLAFADVSCAGGWVPGTLT